MFILSCSEDGMFREIEVDSNNLENFQVMGYGTGRLRIPEMAQQKAKVNAMSNLIDQIAGRDFVYEKSDNSVNFKSTSKGTLSGTKLVDSYELNDNTFLTILSSSMQKMDIDQKNAYLLETEFRTDNLEKALIKKYRIAVEELISRKFKKQSRLTGKLYLSDIKLSDFEGNPDFAVKLKVLIFISNNEQ